MELINLTDKIYQTAKAIDVEKKELEQLAKDKAQAERDYRIALSKAIFELKANGYAATLITDLARGGTAELKFARDLNEALFVAKRSSLDASLSQLTAFQSLLKIMKEVSD